MIALLYAGALAMLVSLFGTWFLIKWLPTKRGDQPILSRDENGPPHQHKQGTPTMGGLAIVVAAFCGWLGAHARSGVIFTNTGLLVMAAILGAGAVGFLDDFLKIRNRRNLGLTARTKVLGLLAVAIGFAVLMLVVTDVHTNLSFTRFDLPGIKLGAVAWAVLTVIVIQSTSNAVNLTDGLDGLASGAGALSFFAYTVVCFWAFRNSSLYQVPHAFELAVISVSMVGACAGFLWWNAAPARIFMGDVGSLAIGTGLACLAMASNTTLLLPIIGGLYVAEVTSVLMQRISYKFFNKRRIFRMTPIHHHFELKGWPETTIIIRFWIVSGILTAIAIGIFVNDFVAAGGAK